MRDEDFQALLGSIKPSNFATEKENTVENAAAEKSQRLGYRDARINYNTGEERPLEQYQSGSEGYSTIGGENVSNRNKIYNNLNSAQQQQYLSDVYDQKIYTDDEGLKYQLPGSKGERRYLDDQFQETGYLYGGNSKRNPNQDKIGYSAFGVKERYTPGLAEAQGRYKGTKGYGWDSGPEGIDANNAYMDWELPQNVAKDAEALIHGNVGNIAGRTTFDVGTTESQAKRDLLGGGASEYYDDRKMGLFGGDTGPEGQILTQPGAGTRSKLEEALDVNGYDSDNLPGETVDIAQSAGLNFATKTYNATKKMDFFGETFEQAADWVDEALGVTTGKGKDFLGTGKSVEQLRGNSPQAQKLRDELTGVQAQTRADFQGTMQASGKDWEEGNYGDSMLKAITVLPQILAESAPEMAALFVPYAGIGIVTGTRLSEQAEEFEKNNGRPMTHGEMLETGAAIMGTLYLEKFAVKTGVTKVSQGLKGKTGAGAAAAGLVESAALEGVQEYSENVQEKYQTRDLKGPTSFMDVATDPENIHAGAIGAIMGGSLRGAGETVGQAVKVPARAKKLKEGYDNKKNRKNWETDVENMSDNEYKLARTSLNEGKKASDLDVESIDKTIELIDGAESSADLQATGNIEVQSYISRLKEAITNSDSTYQSNEIVAAVTAEVNRFMQTPLKNTMLTELGLNEDATVDETIAAVLERKAEGIELLDLQADLDGLINTKIDVNINHYKDNLKSVMNQAKDAVVKNKAGIDETINAMDKTRQKSKTSGRRSDKKIDLKSDELAAATAEPANAKEAIKDVLLGLINKGKLNKTAVKKKLSEYSDKAIQKAISKSDGNSPVAKIGQEILDAREQSRYNLENEIDYDFEADTQKKADATFSRAPSKKAENFRKIKRLVTQANLYSKKEKGQIQDRIDTLQAEGFITKSQAKILSKRLDFAAENVEKGAKSEIKKKPAIFETAAQIESSITNLTNKVKKSIKKFEKALANEDAEMAQELQTEINKDIQELTAREKELLEVQAIEAKLPKQEPVKKEKVKKPVVEKTEETVEKDDKIDNIDETIADNYFTEPELKSNDQTSDGLVDTGEELSIDDIMKKFGCEG